MHMTARLDNEIGTELQPWLSSVALDYRSGR